MIQNDIYSHNKGQAKGVKLDTDIDRCVLSLFRVPDAQACRVTGGVVSGNPINRQVPDQAKQSQDRSERGQRQLPPEKKKDHSEIHTPNFR